MRWPVLLMAPLWIGAIVGVAAIADVSGRLSHTRHTGLGVLCGVIVALLVVLAGHWWDYASSASGRAAGVSFREHLAQERATGIALAKNKAGGVRIGVRGWLVWAAWVLEGGVLVLTGMIGGAAGASRPYCEQCRSWVSRKQWEFTLQDVGEEGVAAVKGRKALESLLALRAGPGGQVGVTRSLLSRVRSCRCGASAELRVKAVTTTKKPDGSTDSRSEWVMDEVMLDPRGLERLCAWAEGIDPSMAEKRPRLNLRGAEPFTITVESCLGPSGEHVSLQRSGYMIGASDSYVDNAYTRALRERLRGGEWEAAAAALKAQRHVEDLAFVAEACADWAGQPPWMDDWEREEPDSAAIALVRGISHVKWGWQARGTGWTPKDIDMFWDRLRTAEEYLLRAAELAPTDPTPWAWLIYAAKGLQHPHEEMYRRLEEAKKRAPNHRPAHSFMIDALAPKWGGSVEEMLGLARRAVAGAPAGSNVAVAIAEAHLEAALTAGRGSGGKEAARAYWSDPAVAAELRKANERCFKSGGYKPTMDTPRTRAYFAYTLWKAGERELAAEHLRVIGKSSPWGPFAPNLPMMKDSVKRARRECGVR